MQENLGRRSGSGSKFKKYFASEITREENRGTGVSPDNRQAGSELCCVKAKKVVYNPYRLCRKIAASLLRSGVREIERGKGA